jgi:hypothetical protein
MALKPETIARLQGILDGTIKIDTTPRPPADLSTLSAETRARIKVQLGGLFEEVKAEVAATTQSPIPLIGFNEEHSMQIQEPNEESLRNADEIIELMAQLGHGDYGAFRKEIALDIYDNGHFSGNWDAFFNPDEYGSSLPGFRVIQEDEYDQHMDEDEDKPDHDSMVGDVPNGYLWMN